MPNDEFFEESSEQSTVKTAIVAKYFWAWAKVIIPSTKKRQGTRISYIDLFCGPGRYKDGTKSTPILILERAVRDPQMREMLVTTFNDANPEHAASLRAAIAEVPDIAKMTHPPQVNNFKVGAQVADMLSGMQLAPTLFFVDPFGYKGLTLNLISSVLKDWGCDCIFFFNYLRINMALDNPVFSHHMDALFEPARADALRRYLASVKAPNIRELTVVEAISKALQEKGGKFVLPFRFRSASGNRTSHHLIFVSKSVLGYTMMKDIMAQESSTDAQGVASFEYNRATKNQPLLFALTTPLADLGQDLLRAFDGRTMNSQEVFREHHVGKRFVRKNYRQALIELEAAGKITTNPSADRRPRDTFADSVKIVFAPCLNPPIRVPLQGDLFG